MQVPQLQQRRERRARKLRALPLLRKRRPPPQRKLLLLLPPPLQETLVSLSIAFEEVPRVEHGCRASVREVAPGFWHVTVRYGFVEVPELQSALAAAARNEASPGAGYLPALLAISTTGRPSCLA